MDFGNDAPSELYGTDAPDKTGDSAVSGSAEQILTSLDFYKVGHHGSTNATPKVVVDSLGGCRREEIRGYVFDAEKCLRNGVAGRSE
jgi:hypothetical protein